jgi:hypothetical protein
MSDREREIDGAVYNRVELVDPSESEGHACCVECHAEIVVYPEECGMLPEELDGERHASHTWRVCELSAALRLARLHNRRHVDPSAPLTTEAFAEVERVAAMVTAEPDEERECLRCRETMGAPSVDEEVAPLCRACVWKVAEKLAVAVPPLLATVKGRGQRIATLEQQLADHDVDGSHAALTAAGVSAGALVERVEDIIGERDNLSNLLSVANEQLTEIRGVVGAGNDEISAIAVRRALADIRRQARVEFGRWLLANVDGRSYMDPEEHEATADVRAELMQGVGLKIWSAQSPEDCDAAVRAEAERRTQPTPPPTTPRSTAPG